MRYPPFQFICLFVFICSSNSVTYAQTILADGFEIHYKKAFNTDFIELSSADYHIRLPDGMKKIRIRIRIQAKPNKRTIFDPNKFYVLSERLKLQLRPYDIKNNALMHIYTPLPRLRKDDPGTEKYAVFPYDPLVKDSFDDFRIKGFYTPPLKISYGKKEYNQGIEYYFKPEKRRRNVIDLYFSFPEGMKNGDFFYGNIKIAEFTVE